MTNKEKYRFERSFLHDHALGYTFLDEMRDPAVPEDMGRDVFPDAGSFR